MVKTGTGRSSGSDAETYKIANVDADAEAVENVTLADVNAYVQKQDLSPW
jgi:hypothetical protein